MLEENNNEENKEIIKDAVNEILESDHLESNPSSINQNKHKNEQDEL